MATAEVGTRARAVGRINIASLIGLDEVRAGRPEVLNGAGELDRPVRWVHVADAEGVGALIEGGELVLSTAAGFRHSATRVRRFLEDLEDGGAAGAFVELVRADGSPDEPASAVLRAAVAGLHLPVVVLRRRIKFVRVTQAAHRLLVGEQLERVERARRVHEIYTLLNLRSADEERILGTTARLLGRPVRLEDAAGRVLLSAGGESDASDRGTGLDTGATYRVPVGTGGRAWGSLVAPDIVPEDEESVQLLERAGQALTLARMAARDQEDLLLRARAGFLQALVAGDISESQARARARDLGLPDADVHVPVVVHLEPGQDEDPTGLQLRERALTEAFLTVSPPLTRSVLTTSVRTGAFALLLGLPAVAQVDQVLTRLVDRVESRVDPPEGPVWTVGVAPGHEGLVGAAANLEEAAQVARAAATMTVRDRPFYRFADIRLRGVLALLADDVRLRTFTSAELGPLLSEGPSWGLDLLETYLRHGGNKSEVARMAHLSRQALYARLARLEEALGVSLEDPESRAALHVALLWWRLGSAST